MVFEKSLIDLVKGIRVHADKESEYISKCLGEIKKELKVTFFSFGGEEEEEKRGLKGCGHGAVGRLGYQGAGASEAHLCEDERGRRGGEVRGLKEVRGRSWGLEGTW